MQRARVIRLRHPDLGEVSEFCFYATRLRYGDLAFDIGANRGDHIRQMLHRGARVLAVEPNAVLVRHLQERFPAAIVLGHAVSDSPGEATLHVMEASDVFSSLDAEWWDGHWDSEQRVQVTTLDALIERYGVPALVKIDTEGHDHRVLQGLSQPVAQVVFEVHADYPEHAQVALERLAGLGRYEYRLERMGSWLFGPPVEAREILAELSSWSAKNWGNVYARAR